MDLNNPLIQHLSLEQLKERLAPMPNRRDRLATYKAAEEYRVISADGELLGTVDQEQDANRLYIPYAYRCLVDGIEEKPVTVVHYFANQWRWEKQIGVKLV